MTVLGIDLAGSERRNSGVAYLEDGKLTCFVLHKDEEILELSKGFSHIFIDAPLSLPKGRANIQERGPHFRACDLMLRERGIKFFPVSLGPMRLLTERGIRLKTVMEGWGKVVYEVFPGAFKELSPKGQKSHLKEGLVLPGSG